MDEVTFHSLIGQTNEIYIVSQDQECIVGLCSFSSFRGKEILENTLDRIAPIKPVCLVLERKSAFLGR